MTAPTITRERAEAWAAHWVDLDYVGALYILRLLDTIAELRTDLDTCAYELLKAAGRREKSEHDAAMTYATGGDPS